MGLTIGKTVESFNSFTLPQPKLVVGLGNVGDKYEKNRHNVGFMSVDHYASANNLPQWSNRSRLKAFITETQSDSDKVIFAKPTTLMNLSGDAVQAIAKFYGVAPDDILIIYDDKDIEFGTVRTRVDGGSGGHNGLKSLISHLGEAFPRIRIGVANDHSDKVDTADFVLSNFSRSESEKLPEILDSINDKIDQFISGGLEEDTTKHG